MKPWRDYADFLADHFGCKMQKLSVNAGFTCPNRDGTIGTGGCVYCDNSTFTPSYCRASDPIAVQLERGKEFFGRKYPDMRYLAYFQSYTNTYGDNLNGLWHEALSVDKVDGIVIGTRPDCVTDEVLDSIARLPWAMVEYGAETSHDSTLRLINRGHTWTQTADAVERTARRGIPVGLHLIMGLPGETEEMMLQTIDRVNTLLVSTLKLHQLQVIRGTRLERMTEPRLRWSAEEYASLCARIVSRLRPDIAIERFTSQAPAGMVVEPRWGLKNYQFTEVVKSLVVSR